MPDQTPSLADQFAADLAAVRWLTVDEIRARARRRFLRNALVAPTAVLVVLVVAWAGTAAVRRDESAPHQPVVAEPLTSQVPAPIGTGGSGAPRSGMPRSSLVPTSVAPGDRVFIPPEALLQPTDRGNGFRSHNEETFAAGEYATWIFDLGGNCPAYESLNATAYQEYLFIRVHTVEKIVDPFDQLDQPMIASVEEAPVVQQTRRFAEETAPQVMADARRVVAACPSYVTTSGASTPQRPTETAHYWALLSESFAGDESLLVRQRVMSLDRVSRQAGEVAVMLIAVVRVGDLVAVLQASGDDPAWMRKIAGQAAARLCAAETGSC